MSVVIKHLLVPEYTFPVDTNPFAYTAVPRRSIDPIAAALNTEIRKIFGNENCLVRGIQSGKYTSKLDKDKLIKRIVDNGSDGYSEVIDERGVLFAAPYEGIQTIQTILSGFHEYKPKCEERPQYPVDVWMIFDKNAFSNIEYLHPRHNVKANDKWQVRDSDFTGLKAIIVID